MFAVLFEQTADGQRYIDWLLSGLGWTLALAFFGWWIAFAIGIVVGIGRTVQNRAIAALARLYVEIFRTSPSWRRCFSGTSSCRRLVGRRSDTP